MRNLQRLRHLRPVGGPEEGVRRTGFVIREEKRIWRRRLRRLAILALVVAVPLAILQLVDALRVVGEAYVTTRPVVLRAQSRVRVVAAPLGPGAAADSDCCVPLERSDARDQKSAGSCCG